MGEIKKGIFRLILGLLIAKSRYTEVMTQSNENDGLKPLLEEAKDQKDLQALEICRLFNIDQSKAISPEMIKHEISKKDSEDSIEQLIIANEELLKDLYQAALMDNEMNAFESFVLSNHLKTEEILLKKIIS
ncbi:hypothetical protein [Ekhidna sp.]